MTLVASFMRRRFPPRQLLLLLAPLWVFLITQLLLRLVVFQAQRGSDHLKAPLRQLWVGIANDLFSSFFLTTFIIAALIAYKLKPSRRLRLSIWCAALGFFGLFVLLSLINVSKVYLVGFLLRPADYIFLEDFTVLIDTALSALTQPAQLAAVLAALAFFALFIFLFKQGLERSMTAISELTLMSLLVVMFASPLCGLFFRAQANTYDMDSHEPLEQNILTFFHIRIRDNIRYSVAYPEAGIASFEEHLGALGGELLHDPSWPTLHHRAAQPDAVAPRSNVVLLILEGFGKDHLRRNPELTPFLNQLSRRSVVLDSHYSNTYRTCGALFNLLCSLHEPLRYFTMIKFPRADLRCLPSQLKRHGYNNLGVNAAKGVFDKMREWSLENEVDQVIAAEDFPPGTPRMDYGVHDGPMLEEASAAIDAASAPFFAFVITVSNHHPFKLPPAFMQAHPEIKDWEPSDTTYFYTDQMIAQFFERAQARPWFDDTLFVIVGDHPAWSYAKGRIYQSSEFDEVRERYKTLALLHHSKLRPRTIEFDTSHVDIAPTIAAFLGVDTTSNFVGRDVLAGRVPPLATLSQVHDRNSWYMISDRDKAIVRHSSSKRCLAMERDAPGVKRECDGTEVDQADSYLQTFVIPLRWSLRQYKKRAGL